MGNRMMDMEVSSGSLSIERLEQFRYTVMITSEKEEIPMMRTGLGLTTENTCSKRARGETRACSGQIQGDLKRR